CLWHQLDELRALVEEAGRHVFRESAGLEVARMHPRSARHLEQIEDAVPFAEAVPEHRDRAELKRGGPEPHEMRVNTVQLAEQHAHPRRTRRDLDREQLLDREDEDELVVLERDVVDPLGIRDRLPPRLLLHRLLEAGVKVADDRSESDDLFAVQIDDEAKNAVRRRMVGSEVDAEDVLALLQLTRDLQDR